MIFVTGFSSGSEKNISNAITITPASVSFVTRSATFERLQGKRPCSCMLFSSISIITTDSSMRLGASESVSKSRESYIIPSTRLTNFASDPVENSSIDAINNVITAPMKKCFEVIGFKELMSNAP